MSNQDANTGCIIALWKIRSNFMGTYYWSTWSAIFAAILFFAGCNHERDEVGALQHKYRGNTDSLITLDYDFGVVRPKEEAKHTFQIQNAGDYPYELKEFVTTCKCVLASLSPEIILPGQSGNATLIYQAGELTIDDSRSVLLRFSDPQSPTYRLRIKAKIRPKIAVIPNTVFIGPLAGDKSDERIVEVQNFSKHKWRDIQAITSENWITAQGECVRNDFTNSQLEMPRQVWRFVLSASSKNNKPGKHCGTVRFLVDQVNEKKESAVATITIQVTPPVVLSPQEFAFGQIAVGKQTSKCIDIFVAANSTDRLDTATIRHNLPGLLNATLSKADRNRWILAARLEPKKSGVIGGSIMLTIPGLTPSSYKIPVTAIVKED